MCLCSLTHCSVLTYIHVYLQVKEAKKYYPLFGMFANVALVFSGQFVRYVSQMKVTLTLTLTPFLTLWANPNPNPGPNEISSVIYITERRLSI